VLFSRLRFPTLSCRIVASSLVSRGIHVSDSGLLVKRAGPAAVAAETDAAGDAGADED